MFRDASDALDSLRLGPHTGGAVPAAAAAAAPASSSDGGGGGSPTALSTSPGAAPMPFTTSAAPSRAVAHIECRLHDLLIALSVCLHIDRQNGYFTKVCTSISHGIVFSDARFLQPLPLPIGCELMHASNISTHLRICTYACADNQSDEGSGAVATAWVTYAGCR